MKKFFSLLLAVLMIAAAFSFTVSPAFAKGSDPVIITAQMLVDSGSLSDPEKNILYPAQIVEDGSIRLVFAKSTNIGKMQFDTKKMDVSVDKSVYSYVKLRYKYHFTKPNETYKCMLREGYSGSSTNHTLFNLQQGNDKWFDDVAKIEWGTSNEPTIFTLHPVRESKSVSANDMFYVDYIGFFATEEEAKAYMPDDDTVNKPVFVEEGNVIEISEKSTDPNAEPIVYEGGALVNDRYRITAEVKNEAGRSYLHTEPTDESNVPKLDNYKVKVDTNVYKYMKICYRTNLDPSMAMDVTSLSDFKDSYKFVVGKQDTWESALFTLGNPASTFTHYHFSCLGPNNAAALEGYYTDIEYIAFFPTAEAAKDFRKETSGEVRVDDTARGKAVKEEIEEIVIEEREVEAVGLGGPLVYAAGAIMKDPYRIITEVRSEDGKDFLHVEPNTAETAVPKIDNYTLSVDATAYHFIKFSYRTNLDTDTELLYQILKQEKQNITFNVVGDEQWHHVTLPLAEPGEGIEKITQAHFSCLGNGAHADALGGKYIDLEYITFYETEEEALEGEDNGGAMVTETHTPYMKGYKNDDGVTNRFGPENTMTRAEACTIVARIKAGSDELVPAEGATAFTDVSGAWYSKYITYLESLGFLADYSGAFTPDADITRAEFVDLVYKLGLVEDTGVTKEFNDVPANHPRYNVIMAAAASELVKGYSNDDGSYSFKPDATITRAEVVTVVNRALGRIVKDLTIPTNFPVSAFTDVDKTHWAFGQIAEATTEHTVYGSLTAKKLSYEVWIYNGLKDGTALDAEIQAIAAAKKEAVLNSKDEHVVTGKTIYVSSIHGSDSNDGLSPETPFATLPSLNKIAIVPGDAILFERGSIFRGHFTAKGNCFYGAYGEGPKPRFYGSPYDGAVTGTWTPTAENPNIWVYSEKMGGDIGAIFFDADPDGNGYAAVGIKKCTANKNDGIENVKQNYDFWYNPKDSKVYLYLDKGNPATLYKSIEFNEYGNICNCQSDNVTFDNLCFLFGGRHGIGCGGVSNVHITNCVAGYMGGGSSGDTRLGNGFEIWAPSQNCSIKDCYVFEVYDAGITFQMKGTSGSTCTFNNIVFEDNLIEKCIYNIEYFLRQEDNDGDYIANTTLRNNILLSAGYGWGVQRPERGGSAAIKGWDSENKSSNFVIENNIIDRGLEMLIHIGSTAGSKYLPIMRNNTYIQTKGGRLGRWNAVEIQFNEAVGASMSLGAMENTEELYIVEK